MGLNSELISQFAKVVNKDKNKKVEATVYGTVMTDEKGNKYVRLDGSDQLTPLSDDNRPEVDSATAVTNEGDRVSVLIKNHTATVTGNLTSPAVRNDDFKDLGDQVTEIKEFDVVIAEKVQANEAYFKKIIADEVTLGKLEAAGITVAELLADSATIDDLIAGKITVTDLIATKIDAEVVEANYATIKNLEATNLKVTTIEGNQARFEEATVERLDAVEAEIDELTVGDLDAKYANIDFANITEASIRNFFTKSGMIENVIIGDATVSGSLVGVTIKGDLIEAGTVKADKLVIKGDDGIYYKLNIDAGATTSEQVSEEDLQNGLHGDAILAHTITAEKINVHDLVAFGATIGHFHIDENDAADGGSIYSGVKSSVDNTTRGIYMDTDGQFNVGDGNNFFKFYQDADGSYKLVLSVSSLEINTRGKKIEELIDEMATSEELKETNDKITDINDSITEIRKDVDLMVTDESLKIQIQKVIDDGVKKVDTGTGFSFDETGMTVDKTNADTKTQITENGMNVYTDGKSDNLIDDSIKYDPDIGRIYVGSNGLSDPIVLQPGTYYLSSTFANGTLGYMFVMDAEEYVFLIENHPNTSTAVFTLDKETKVGISVGSDFTVDEIISVTLQTDVDVVMLKASKDGVDAKNLHAKTYLIIGKNSRFEDYNGGTRTGCFWIGG